MSRSVTFLCVLSFLLLSGCSGSRQADVILDTESEKFSYTLGLDMGYSIAQFGAEIDEDALYAGISARVSGKKPVINKIAQAKVKLAVFKRLAEQRAHKAKVASEKKAVAQKTVGVERPDADPVVRK